MAADCKSAAPCELRRFESSSLHQRQGFKREISPQRGAGPSTLGKGGSNSVVESQPSKLLVAGSIPVSRSRVEPT
jgi:hypothetical protein